MRMLLLMLAAVTPLALSGCGSDEKTVVVNPPGGTVVVPEDAKVCAPGATVC